MSRRPQPKSYWHNGYDPNLSSVQLPEKVKCGACRKLKPCSENHFSKKQLDTVRKYMKDSGSSALLTVEKFKCVQCTDQQRVEMCCKWCDKYKALDDFPKQQRRDPDDATCWKCRDKLNQDGTMGSDSDNPDDTDDEVDDAHNDDGEEDIANDIANMSIAETNSSIGGVTVPRTVTASEPGWTEQKGGGFAAKTTSAMMSSGWAGYGSSTVPSRVFDVNAYGGAINSAGGSVKARDRRWAKPPKGGNQQNSTEDEHDDEDGESVDEGFTRKIRKETVSALPGEDESGDDYSD